MALVDGRTGGGGGGGITSVNGDTGPAVTITAASLGAASAPVTQGTPGAPLAIDNLDVVALDITNSEVLYLAGDGANQTIDLANFTGVKNEGLFLKIVVKGAFALTFQQGGNFILNGNRRCVNGSIMQFYCDGVNYIEEGGNEIA